MAVVVNEEIRLAFGAELAERYGRQDRPEPGPDEKAAEGPKGMREYGLLLPEPKAGTLRFADYPFQEEFYTDECAALEHVVVMKSTQVGISTWLWRWVARQVDQFGDTGLYVFPTDTHVKDFAVERVDPSIEVSDYLQSRIPKEYVSQQKLKRIGLGFMHFRGSNSRAGAQSVAADALAFDENDELDQTNLAQMERRLSGARAAGRVPRVRRVGVPTIDGFGIAAHYARSDRREWHVTCGSCGHEAALSWERNVRWTTQLGGDTVCLPGNDVFVDSEDVERAWRVCVECEAELDVRKGRWIAQNPGAHVRGYHVSRLIVPKTDLEQIVRASRKTAPHELEAFFNNDLGLPYSPAEGGLTEDAIRAACSRGDLPVSRYEGPWPVTMGLDVASERNMNARISAQMPDGSRRALWIGEVESFEDADALIRDFNVTMCAVDSMPERQKARELAANWPGRVVLARYDDSNPEADPIVYDDRRNLVTVHRAESIDAMMDAIRSGRSVPLSQVPPKYVEHMKALKRRTVYDPRGRPRRVYVTTGGQGDDYAHAEVFDLVATEMWRLFGMVSEEPEPVDVAEDFGFEETYEPGFG